MSPEDSRQGLLNLLGVYLHTYPHELETVGRYRQFVESNDRCFERSLSIGHVTGSALILSASASKVLLTHHRKLDRWLQPGGHADGDSDVLGVALKEAEEETGLARIEPVTVDLFDIDIHSIPLRGSEPEHLHYDCRFLLRSVGSDEFTVSDESHDLAWVALDRILDYTSDPSILRMIDKVRELL
ncbi:MAG: NUDIX hydrolase [Gammaproteobacteria bacterium]|jgi:8-oxo-dGTP pyrophosphatase MutT (NUDIX family)|nr:NUDIX hydrolase [Gammaproteobacteria bacterium]MBT4491963.1 NUDIX hydrolase [Gammaproteobacteria bacterium]MBT7371920.1 NUDIX hydrolase [Gammaproteobacteria bacterium]